MGRKNGKSEGEKELSDTERFLRSKREEAIKCAHGEDNVLSPANGPIFVPASQPIPEESSDQDKVARLKEYERLSKLSQKRSKAIASEFLDENRTVSKNNAEK
jgi:hypothetical protein